MVGIIRLLSVAKVEEEAYLGRRQCTARGGGNVLVCLCPWDRIRSLQAWRPVRSARGQQAISHRESREEDFGGLRVSSTPAAAVASP